MQRRISAVVALVTILAALACSERSLVSPDTESDAVRLAVQSAPGSYVISFLKETSSGLAPAADTEPLGTYLVLKSQVRDNAGNLAQIGSVTYEYCWANGDYAPSSSCNSGSGRWKRFWSVNVDAVGSLVGFGSCSTPKTIGFRFTYSGRRSGIANGVSATKDFTWAAI